MCPSSLSLCQGSKRLNRACFEKESVRTGWFLVCALKARFYEVNQVSEVTCISVFHRPNILIANLIPLSHKLDLWPLRNRMLTRVQENISDKPCMPSIPIDKGMNICI